jgi:hypothetical protein
MDFNEKPKPKGHFDALFSGISLSLSLSHTHMDKHSLPKTQTTILPFIVHERTQGNIWNMI